MQNLLEEWLLKDLNYTAVTTQYKIYFKKWKQLLITLRTGREMVSVEFVSGSGHWNAERVGWIILQGESEHSGFFQFGGKDVEG